MLHIAHLPVKIQLVMAVDIFFSAFIQKRIGPSCWLS